MWPATLSFTLSPVGLLSIHVIAQQKKKLPKAQIEVNES